MQMMRSDSCTKLNDDTLVHAIATLYDAFFSFFKEVTVASSTLP